MFTLLFPTPLVRWPVSFEVLLMDTGQERLVDAMLGGVPCKAIAWVDVKRIRVIDQQRGQRVVEGVRTWHGQAVVECDTVPAQWEYNSAVRFVGKVVDGEQEMEVNADVYIHHRLHRPMTANLTTMDRAARHRLQVRFTGAGNLRWQ